MGLWDYTFQVAIPSLLGFFLDSNGWLPINYYSQPWEYEADKLGGVSRNVPLVNIDFSYLLNIIAQEVFR